MAKVQPDTALARPEYRPGAEPERGDQAIALDKLIALGQPVPPRPRIAPPAPARRAAPGPPAPQWPDGWSVPARPGRDRPALDGPAHARPLPENHHGAPAVTGRVLESRPAPSHRRPAPGHRRPAPAPAPARAEPRPPAGGVPRPPASPGPRAAPRPRPAAPVRTAARPARRAAAWALNDLAAARTEGPEAWLADPDASDLTGRHGPVVRGLDPALASAVVDIRRMSGGLVEKVLPLGPVLAADPERRRLRKSTFTYLLKPSDRLVVALLSAGWAVCMVFFWMWWLEPAHRIGTLGVLLNSVVLLYVLCYPVAFVIAINRLRCVRKTLAVPLLRTAFVVTRAPSEPWDVAEATLSAMLDQDFPLPYDVWLCDERPSADVIDWCDENGVMLASRNGVDGYHRETWPRRTKCKEGNLAYFYDHWGYRYYDVVAQLDCDHRPTRTYLSEVVRPFSDPAVGYVAAPSVCDTNAGGSWAARGRLHREAAFHGPFQLGHSDGWGPLCIGSHYAVRTHALREVGGIGPELAEDWTTSFLITTAGWHGAFAMDAEAHGDGPNTFAAMLVQEFQWSRSLTMVLLGLVPRNLRPLPWRLKLRFMYALTFYGLLVTCTVGGLVLALTAAVTGRPWMNVNYVQFLLHWWSISVWLMLLTVLLRRRGLLRPHDAPLISWENWLYTLTRWPFIAWGIWAALMQTLRPRPVTFKVTPKGSDGLERLPLRLMWPFVLVSVACSVAAVIGEATNYAAGYVFLCMLSGLMYSVVTVTVPVLHASEAARRARVRFSTALWRTARAPLVLALFGLLPIALAIARYPSYAMHVFPIWSIGSAP